MPYRDDDDSSDVDQSSSIFPTTQATLDWGISGSIVAILGLAVLYVFSPVDVIPDVFPVPGEVDDVAAVLAGGGSILFLALLRFVLRPRVNRWGCLLGIIVSAASSFVVFWALMKILNAII